MMDNQTSFEHIDSTPSSEKRAQEILELFDASSVPSTIAIAGESGSGKSTTAYSLLTELERLGMKVLVLHLDNYFKDIPKINEEKRRINLLDIGPPEINLQLLQEHMLAFKNGDEKIVVPILSQDRSEFVQKDIDLKNIDVLIIEGTFVFHIELVDLRVFIDLSYKKSKARRIGRGRDTVDEFSERVLEIEHALIQPYHKQADIFIDEEGVLTSKV